MKLKDNTNSIAVDASLSLYPNGAIDIEVFFGTASEPSHTSVMTLEALVENLMESLTAGSTNKLASYHKEDADHLVKTLENLVKHTKKRVKELS